MYMIRKLCSVVCVLGIFWISGSSCNDILFAPSYISSWEPIKAGDASKSEIVFNHGLSKLPVKLEAELKVVRDQETYIFKSIGSAQEVNGYHGGVVCLYDENIAVVYASMLPKAQIGYTGGSFWHITLPSTTGINHLDFFPMEGEVRVLAWTEWDFPRPVYETEWTEVDVNNPPSIGHLEFNHSLGFHPEHVVVQVKGQASRLVSSADGSVPVMEGKTVGGVMFAFSDQSVRVWIPLKDPNDAGKRVALFLTEGWGSGVDPKFETKGFVKIRAWKFGNEGEKFNHVDSQGAWHFGQAYTTCKEDGCLHSLQAEVNSGYNKGFRFPSIGSAMNDGSSGPFAGLLYSFSPVNWKLWFFRPKATSTIPGYVVGITGRYGNALTQQKTNDNRILMVYRIPLSEAYVNCDEDINRLQRNNTEVDTGGLAGFPYNSTINVTCTRGYRVVRGCFTLRCNRYGIWDGSCICTEITCPNPANDLYISEGASNMSGLNIGDEIIYECDDGFEFTNINDTIRTCQEDGTWSGIVPTCTRVSCPREDLQTAMPSNIVQITVGSLLYQDIATYRCREGFPHVSGDLARTCQMNKTWSGEPPVCEYCNCSCSSPTIINETQPLEEVIEQLKAELTVAKQETTVSKRKKISVFENRPSAMGIGALAITLLVSLVLLLILPDIPRLVTDARLGYQNIKIGLSQHKKKHGE